MNESLLHLYHHLPGPLRSVASSMKGFQLRTLRYGHESERLIEEALEREQWTLERWNSWKQDRLAYILHRAATRVPYYRAEWTARRRKGDRASWEYIQNWPILEKEMLREKSKAFIADDCNIRLMFREHTSGTTGKPLNLWWSRKTVRMWFALFEARWRRWYGVSRKDRWAIVCGQLVTSMADRKPPFWVWNRAMNQLYMSSYHLAPDLIPYYLESLKKYEIRYIFGYSSSLYALAQEAIRLQRNDIKMIVALTNAEPLFSYQRKAIAEAFECPVRQTYGMAEMVTAASECRDTELHLWPEVGSVEVFDGRGALEDGNTGDLVCTSLLNADMPLIRYRVGDRGALRHPNDVCACGRGLPRIMSLDGRQDDILYTADGRRIGRLDPIFKTELSVREAQIIQEAIDKIRLRYVPAQGFTSDAVRVMVDRLRDRMGNIQVVLEQLDEIPRETNGKFRAVICRLPQEQLKINHA